VTPITLARVALSPRTSALLRRVGSELLRRASTPSKQQQRRTRGSGSSAPTPRAPARPAPTSAPATTAYRGDFTGRATISYQPDLDGDADPGEVVWAWVPYEEDHRQGKDRPVLVIARDGDDLLGLMLTSKDHDRRVGPDDLRRFHDLGSGDWDRQGRPSEVRLDRVLRLSPSAVRREGAILDRARFDAVTADAKAVLGW
jgi:hypothetical protein